MERKGDRRLSRNYRRLISRNCRKSRAMKNSLSVAARRLPADQLPQRCNEFRELRPGAAIVTKRQQSNGYRGFMGHPREIVGAAEPASHANTRAFASEAGSERLS